MNLLQVAAADGLDMEVRQVAAITFKNLIRKGWTLHENRAGATVHENDETDDRDGCCGGGGGGHTLQEPYPQGLDPARESRGCSNFFSLMMFMTAFWSSWG